MARTWAALSYAALDEPLPENVPEHEFFEAYQPDYTFAIRPSYRRDCNVDAYLDTLYKHIDSALSSIGAAVRGVPSNVEDAMALGWGEGLAANVVGKGVTLCGGGGRELEEGGQGETCQETNAVATRYSRVA